MEMGASIVAQKTQPGGDHVGGKELLHVSRLYPIQRPGDPAPRGPAGTILAGWRVQGSSGCLVAPQLPQPPAVGIGDLQDPLWLGMAHEGSQGKVLTLHAGLR